MNKETIEKQLLAGIKNVKEPTYVRNGNSAAAKHKSEIVSYNKLREENDGIISGPWVKMGETFDSSDYLYQISRIQRTGYSYRDYLQRGDNFVEELVMDQAILPDKPVDEGGVVTYSAVDPNLITRNDVADEFHQNCHYYGQAVIACDGDKKIVFDSFQRKLRLFCTIVAAILFHYVSFGDATVITTFWDFVFYGKEGTENRCKICIDGKGSRQDDELKLICELLKDLKIDTPSTRDRAVERDIQALSQMKKARIWHVILSIFSKFNDPVYRKTASVCLLGRSNLECGEKHLEKLRMCYQNFEKPTDDPGFFFVTLFKKIYTAWMTSIETDQHRAISMFVSMNANQKPLTEREVFNAKLCVAIDTLERNLNDVDCQKTVERINVIEEKMNALGFDEYPLVTAFIMAAIFDARVDRPTSGRNIGARLSGKRVTLSCTSNFSNFYKDKLNCPVHELSKNLEDVMDIAEEGIARMSYLKENHPDIFAAWFLKKSTLKDEEFWGTEWGFSCILAAFNGLDPADYNKADENIETLHRAGLRSLAVERTKGVRLQKGVQLERRSEIVSKMMGSENFESNRDEEFVDTLMEKSERITDKDYDGNVVWNPSAVRIALKWTRKAEQAEDDAIPSFEEMKEIMRKGVVGSKGNVKRGFKFVDSFIALMETNRAGIHIDVSDVINDLGSMFDEEHRDSKSVNARFVGQPANFKVINPSVNRSVGNRFFSSKTDDERYQSSLWYERDIDKALEEMCNEHLAEIGQERFNLTVEQQKAAYELLTDEEIDRLNEIKFKAMEEYMHD